MIRKSVYMLAAVLTLAGCSKEELTETTTEGISSVATPTNGNARFGNPNGMPEIWFNENNGRMMLKVPPRWTHVALSASVRSSAASGNVDDPDGNPDDVIMEGELTQVGNSRIYRSGQDQFVFGTESYFSLVDVTLTSNTFVDDWQGETAYLQLFVYPSGRTVEQDPKVARIRTRSVTNTDSAHEMAMIIVDDPAQEVAEVKFVPDPIYGNPDDPTEVIYLEPTYFQKTHENQNLGLSRWTGGTWSGTGTTTVSGTFYLLDNGGTPVTIFSWGQVLD